MTDTKYDILGEVLPAIDPAALDYQQWVDVGMALKDGGYTAQDWEDWSRRDPKRYHPGECAKKWRTLTGSGITLGTLVQYARDQGWRPMRHFKVDKAYGWDDVIGAHGADLNVVEDPDQLEQHPLPRLFSKWDPRRELTRYLELLFSPDEIVGYVASTWYNREKDKHMPDKGVYTRTAGELISALAQGTLNEAIGDTNPDAGAWIRFNPLDGKGIRNENVTEYRYALVESDSIPVEQQYAVYRALELPARVLVHSGGKSLHAIVHIGASSYNEYRDRVAYLYRVCEANGLKIDGQNKNPSRLSRMPGVMRGGNQQYIVAENQGYKSFEAWREYIESVNDDLPDPENLAEVWDDLPPLSPPLIEGVLRQGHKMMLAGASKSGKSFALLELAIAIAEGGEWLGFQCARGRVLYVNLEVDQSSIWHRLKDVYKALGIAPNNLKNLDVWNLRGSACPLDKLAPKLIRRAKKRGYIAIILDPIYKVSTGDENSADQVSHFCNQLDMIATQLNCAMIYCHHHSKGAQGGKASMDRASGSGVFARDADALLDMVRLPVPEEARITMRNRRQIELCVRAMQASMAVTRWQELVSDADLTSAPRMLEVCKKWLAPYERERLEAALAAAEISIRDMTAWRIEGTLREFASFEPVDLWFEHPVHHVDTEGALKDVKPDGGGGESWKERGWKAKADSDQKQRDAVFDAIWEAVSKSASGSVAIRDLEICTKTGNPYPSDTISEWFGEGKEAREYYKQNFVKYLGKDRRAYLRFREDTDE